MPWVLDTCVLIDVAMADPAFGRSSARLIDSRRSAGLVICPVSYAELAPVFGGDQQAQDVFLADLGIPIPAEWTWSDTVSAHAAWHRHVLAKRGGHAVRRPLADLLIGAFSERFDGLITRNEADFRPTFPALRIVTP
jgi:hypothetical protein